MCAYGVGVDVFIFWIYVMTIQEIIKKQERIKQNETYIATEKLYEDLDDRCKEKFLEYKLMEFIEAEHWKRDCLWWSEILKEWTAYDVIFPQECNKWEWWDVGKFAIFKNTWTMYKIIAHSEDWTPIVQVVHTGDICFANEHIDLVS